MAGFTWISEAWSTNLSIPATYEYGVLRLPREGKGVPEKGEQYQIHPILPQNNFMEF